MAEKKPIKISHPGKLTAAAARARQSINSFAKSHMDSPSIGAAARLYENVLKPANKARKGHWSGK
jgi:hypothetical protein